MHELLERIKYFKGGPNISYYFDLGSKYHGVQIFGYRPHVPGLKTIVSLKLCRHGKINEALKANK